MTSDKLAAAHAATIRGFTIPMGDGSLFDYGDPGATTMSLEDYAWGIACQPRFSGQTRLIQRLGMPRCFYGVAEHCYRGAREIYAETQNAGLALEFMTHESGEVVWGDAPSPRKKYLPVIREHEKVSELAINRRFRWTQPRPDLIKFYDLRMLATEYRDLVNPACRASDPPPRDCPAFDRQIIGTATPEAAAYEWLGIYKRFAAMLAGQKEKVSE